MMIVSESDFESQKKIHSGTRHSRAVTGHAAATAASVMRERSHKGCCRWLAHAFHVARYRSIPAHK